MKVRMVRWGNSLAVRIPTPVADAAGLKEGDSIEIHAVAEGHVDISRTSKIPTLKQLVSRILPENRYTEISACAEVGKEIVKW